jgi:hypothetical protein
MNPGLFILWVIVVVLLVVLVFMSYKAVRAWFNEQVVIVPDRTGPCIIAFDALPQLNELQCCFVGETLTASRYVQSLNMVVNPIAVGYLEVCQGFCTNGINTDGTSCVNGIGQSDFEKCILISEPRNCTGPAMPVAALGATFFYPNSATSVSCLDQRPC